MTEKERIEDEVEYTVSWGMHVMCDPMKAQPAFGIFRDLTDAKKRADHLGGHVMQRAVNGWTLVDASLERRRG